MDYNWVPCWPPNQSILFLWKWYRSCNKTIGSLKFSCKVILRSDVAPSTINFFPVFLSFPHWYKNAIHDADSKTTWCDIKGIAEWLDIIIDLRSLCRQECLRNFLEPFSVNILHNRMEISMKEWGSLCFQLQKELMDAKGNKKQICYFDKYTWVTCVFSSKVNYQDIP